jgi:hypothetical protein
MNSPRHQMHPKESIKVTSRNIISVIAREMEAAYFPGKNTELIIKAAQAKGMMPNAEKFTTREFVMGIRAFVGYALEQAFRSWCLSWWKARLCRMWLRGGQPGGFQVEDAISVCVAVAKKEQPYVQIRSRPCPELPGWLEG